MSINRPYNRQRLVIDTVALVSYFSAMFDQNPKISERAISLIDSAFLYDDKVLDFRALNGLRRI